MEDERRLPDSLGRFIERLGLYFEDFGLPRIGGRLLGLLLVTDRPLSLDEIAGNLQVSRASVSTNARLVVAAGLVERVGLPGDRRDYYAFTDRAWESVIETDARGVSTLQALARDALAELGETETPARGRLQSTLDFLEFYQAELAASLARWRERTVVVASAPPDGGTRSKRWPSTNVRQARASSPPSDEGSGRET